jgi:thiol-disulfide isomerase/thioredoxin
MERKEQILEKCLKGKLECKVLQGLLTDLSHTESISKILMHLYDEPFPTFEMSLSSKDPQMKLNVTIKDAGSFFGMLFVFMQMISSSKKLKIEINRGYLSQVIKRLQPCFKKIYLDGKNYHGFVNEKLLPWAKPERFELEILQIMLSQQGWLSEKDLEAIRNQLSSLSPTPLQGSQFLSTLTPDTAFIPPASQKNPYLESPIPDIRKPSLLDSSPQFYQDARISLPPISDKILDQSPLPSVSQSLQFHTPIERPPQNNEPSGFTQLANEPISPIPEAAVKSLNPFDIPETDQEQPDPFLLNYNSNQVNIPLPAVYNPSIDPFTEAQTTNPFEVTVHMDTPHSNPFNLPTSSSPFEEDCPPPQVSTSADNSTVLSVSEALTLPLSTLSSAHKLSLLQSYCRNTHTLHRHTEAVLFYRIIDEDYGLVEGIGKECTGGGIDAMVCSHCDTIDGIGGIDMGKVIKVYRAIWKKYYKDMGSGELPKRMLGIIKKADTDKAGIILEILKFDPPLKVLENESFISEIDNVMSTAESIGDILSKLAADFPSDKNARKLIGNEIIEKRLATRWRVEQTFYSEIFDENIATSLSNLLKTLTASKGKMIEFKRASDSLESLVRPLLTSLSSRSTTVPRVQSLCLLPRDLAITLLTSIQSFTGTHPDTDFTTILDTYYNSLTTCKSVMQMVDISHTILTTKRLSPPPVLTTIGDILSLLADIGNCDVKGVIDSPFCRIRWEKAMSTCAEDTISIKTMANTAQMIIKEVRERFDGGNGLDREFLADLVGLVGDDYEKFSNNLAPVCQGDNEVEGMFEYYLINVVFGFRDQMKTSLGNLGEKLSNFKMIRGINSDKLAQLTQVRQARYLQGGIPPGEQDMFKFYAKNCLDLDKLTECMRLFEYFINKPIHHIFELLIDADLVYHSISIKEVQYLELFIKKMNELQEQKLNLDDFVFSLLNNLPNDLVPTLFPHIDALINCSKTYTPTEASNLFNFLEGASFVFMYNSSKSKYEISAVKDRKVCEQMINADSTNQILNNSSSINNRDNNVMADQQSMMTPTNANLNTSISDHHQSVLTESTLEGTMIKLLLMNTLDRDNNNDVFKRNKMVFIDSIAAGRRIKSLLMKIRARGDIVDINKAISALDVSSICSGGDCGNFEEFIRERNFNLVVVLGAFGEEGLKYKSNLEILEAILKLLLEDKTYESANNPNTAKLISMLTASQKITLCNYFLKRESDKATNLTTEKVDAMSLLTYCTNKTINEADIDKITLSPQVKKMYHSTPILSEILSKFVTIEKTNKEASTTVISPIVRYSAFQQNSIEALFLAQVTFKVPKLKHQTVLFLNSSTLVEDVITFLKRATSDSAGTYYFLLDYHLLVQSSRLRVMAYLSSLPPPPALVNRNIFILMHDTANGVYKEMIRYDDITVKRVLASTLTLKDARPEDRASFTTLADTIPMTVVHSNMAGLGKSYYIDHEDRQGMIIEINISGEMNKEAIDRRLEIIESKLKDRNIGRGYRGYCLHIKIDMVENMLKKLEIVQQVLFSIIVLRCIEFRNGYMYFNNVERFFVEVGNSYKDLILKGVPLLNINENEKVQIPPLKITTPNRLDIPLLQRGGLHNVDPQFQTRLSTIVSYWQLLKSNRIGTTSYSDLSPQHNQNLTPQVLLQALSDIFTSSSTHPEHTSSLTQLTLFINHLSTQLMEFDNIPSFNPAIAPHLARWLTVARPMIVTSIFNTCRHVARGTANSVRMVNVHTLNAVDRVSMADTDGSESFEEIMSQYQQMIARLPQWEDDDKEGVQFFFSNGSFKVLYRDYGRVTEEIKNIVWTCTGSELPNLTAIESTKDQKVYFRELIEGLELEKRHVIAENQRNSAMQADNSPSRMRSQIITLNARTQSQGNSSLNKVLKGEDLIDKIVERAKSFQDKTFVLKHDNYLKIMRISERADLGQPIVIMGATGCGKTYLINFMVTELMNEEFLKINLHPGYSEQSLVEAISKAVQKAKNMFNPEEPRKSRRVWVFFDEFNTSPLQSLIAELMMDRKATFTPLLGDIPSNIVFVAACNPYRIRANTSAVGLSPNSVSRVLSHRVYPIPDSLINSLWDFGQLTQEKEKAYIRGMLPSEDSLLYDQIYDDLRFINVIVTSQNYIRQIENESSVSLRDVERFLKLFALCKELFKERPYDSLIMTTFICYFLRIEKREQREKLDKLLSESFPTNLTNTSIAYFSRTFERLSGSMVTEVCQLYQLPEDINMNTPLCENLVALLLCIPIRIPVFICGKPGTSKTVAATIAQSLWSLDKNIKATSKYLRHVDNIKIFNFWGSNLTTCESIMNVFDKAKKNETENKRNKSQSVIIFDEIGLAEISEDNPLKILHFLLEEPDCPGFIGLSNWRLDLSKMNRTLFVSRGDPEHKDLSATFAKSAVKDERLLEMLTEGLVQAYVLFRQAQEKIKEVCNFHGTRDLYNMRYQLNALFEVVTSIEAPMNDKIGFIVNTVISRNFSGIMSNKLRSEENFLKIAQQELSKLLTFKIDLNDKLIKKTSSLDMIFHNIMDTRARHLMLLCESSLIEDVVIEQIRRFTVEGRKKDPKYFAVFRGTRSKEEEFELISSLAVYIQQGYTLILKDLDRVYSCMYELLNQRYEVRQGLKGCNLIYDTHKQWVSINPDFRCIVLASRQDTVINSQNAEKIQPPPFLNRFEKQLVMEEDILSLDQQGALKSSIADYIDKESKTKTILIHNLSKELLMSLATKDSAISDKYKLANASSYKDYIGKEFSRLLQPEAQDKERSATKMNSKQRREDMDRYLQRLFSRNMALEYLAKNQDLSELERIFTMNQTQESMSLSNLIKSSINSIKDQKHSVVFTLSDPSIVHSTLQANGHDKHTKLLQYQDVVPDIAGDTKESIASAYTTSANIILLQLVGLFEWKILPSIKQYLLDNSTQKGKVTIILLHYSREDVENRCSLTSSFDLSSKSWSLLTIDDLSNNDHKQFFAQFESTTLSLLSQSSSPLISTLTVHIFNILSSYLSSIDMNRCIDILRNDKGFCGGLCLAVVERAKNSGGECAIKELVTKDKLEGCRNFLDCQEYFGFLIARSVTPCVKEVIETIHKRLGFNYLILSNAIIEDQKDNINVKKWMNAAIKCLSTSTQDNDPSQYKIYSHITSTIDLLTITKTIQQKALMIRRDIKEACSGVKNRFHAANPVQMARMIQTEIIELVTCSFDPNSKEMLLPFADMDEKEEIELSEKILIGIMVKDEYFRSSNIAMADTVISKIILFMARQIITFYSQSKNSTLKLIDIIIFVLALSWMYEEDLSLISLVFRSQAMTDKTLDIICRSFNDTWNIDVKKIQDVKYDLEQVLRSKEDITATVNSLKILQCLKEGQSTGAHICTTKEVLCRILFTLSRDDYFLIAGLILKEYTEVKKETGPLSEDQAIRALVALIGSVLSKQAADQKISNLIEHLIEDIYPILAKWYCSSANLKMDELSKSISKQLIIFAFSLKSKSPLQILAIEVADAIGPLLREKDDYFKDIAFSANIAQLNENLKNYMKPQNSLENSMFAICPSSDFAETMREKLYEFHCMRNIDPLPAVSSRPVSMDAMMGILSSVNTLCKDRNSTVQINTIVQEVRIKILIDSLMLNDDCGYRVLGNIINDLIDRQAMEYMAGILVRKVVVKLNHEAEKLIACGYGRITQMLKEYKEPDGDIDEDKVPYAFKICNFALAINSDMTIISSNSEPYFTSFSHFILNGSHNADDTIIQTIGQYMSTVSPSVPVLSTILSNQSVLYHLDALIHAWSSLSLKIQSSLARGSSSTQDINKMKVKDIISKDSGIGKAFQLFVQTYNLMDRDNALGIVLDKCKKIKDGYKVEMELVVKDECPLILMVYTSGTSKREKFYHEFTNGLLSVRQDWQKKLGASSERTVDFLHMPAPQKPGNLLPIFRKYFVQSRSSASVLLLPSLYHCLLTSTHQVPFRLLPPSPFMNHFNNSSMQIMNRIDYIFTSLQSKYPADTILTVQDSWPMQEYQRLANLFKEMSFKYTPQQPEMTRILLSIVLKISTSDEVKIDQPIQQFAEEPDNIPELFKNITVRHLHYLSSILMATAYVLDPLPSAGTGPTKASADTLNQLNINHLVFLLIVLAAQVHQVRQTSNEVNKPLSEMKGLEGVPMDLLHGYLTSAYKMENTKLAALKISDCAWIIRGLQTIFNKEANNIQQGNAVQAWMDD